MNCDMCGSIGKLYKTIVEDAQLNVCHECSKLGKVIDVVKQEDVKVGRSRNDYSQPETMQIIVDDYAKKIREKRESLGLKQKDFAKKINEKESLIQKIESNHFEPSIVLAKKIGSFLKIKLVEEYEESHEKQVSSKTGAFTIGDIIKIKDNVKK